MHVDYRVSRRMTTAQCWALHCLVLWKLIKWIVLIVNPNHLLGHGDRKPVQWVLNSLDPGDDATMWCPNCTVTMFSKLTLCSWSTQFKQAVFPVPGAPEMYRLDGFPGATCFSRKETITPRSGSLESSRSGTAVWRACFTQWYGVSEKQQHMEMSQ